MIKIDMTDYGLSERFANESRLYENLTVGRIISQDKDLYRAITENGEVRAQISGKFRYNATGLSDYPSTGDFVMLSDNADGNAIIHHVLTRKSAFVRKAAGTSNNEQIVAANIDTVFICMSLNNDFNLRRLERYMGVAWDSGATPVVVLTKADLNTSLEQAMSDLQAVALSTDIIVTSGMTEDGYLPVKEYIHPGKTVAFIGSSGVGKTTLVNRLVGSSMYETNSTRNDDRGRHTTTKRELVLLTSGGIVIDTPGMRELGIESADLSKAFSDIDELSLHCRFSDCTHTNEPGCAVLEAIGNGALSKERFSSFLKLKKEAKYEGLNSKQIETKKLNEMFKGYGGIKNARNYMKNKNNKH